MATKVASQDKNFSNTYAGKIAVCALQLDGRGDIIGGRRISQITEALLPQAKVTFTVLQPVIGFVEFCALDGSDRVDLKDIAEVKEWTNFVEEKTVLKTIDTFNLIVVYPTYHDTLLPDAILNSKTPILKFREPGLPKPEPKLVQGPVCRLGFNTKDGEMGNILPTALDSYYREHGEETSLQKLKHLQHVEPLITKAILGKPFSEEAVQQFNANTKLFYGYCHARSIKIAFVNSLCNNSEKHNVTVCLLGYPISGLKNSLSQRILFEKGFKNIKILTKDGTITKEASSFKDKAKGSRELTVIMCSLSPSEAMSLFKAAEKEVLVTGNETFFEALTLRKAPAYEVRAHRQELWDSFVSLATQKNPAFKSLLKECGCNEESSSSNIDAMTKGMSEFFKKMQEDPALEAAWKEMISDMFTKNEFEANYLATLERSIPEKSAV